MKVERKFNSFDFNSWKPSFDTKLNTSLKLKVLKFFPILIDYFAHFLKAENEYRWFFQLILAVITSKLTIDEIEAVW